MMLLSNSKTVTTWDLSLETLELLALVPTSLYISKELKLQKDQGALSSTEVWSTLEVNSEWSPTIPTSHTQTPLIAE